MQTTAADWDMEIQMRTLITEMAGMTTRHYKPRKDTYRNLHWQHLIPASRGYG